MKISEEAKEEFALFIYIIGIPVIAFLIWYGITWLLIK